MVSRKEVGGLAASTWLTLPAATLSQPPQLRGLVHILQAVLDRPFKTRSLARQLHVPSYQRQLPCPAPQRAALRFCALAFPRPCSFCVPSHLPTWWAQLSPQASVPFPDAVPLFLTGHSRASFSFCPSAKDKGSSQVPWLSWSRQDPWALGARLVHGQCKADACPKTVGPASSGQQDRRQHLTDVDQLAVILSLSGAVH